METSLVSVERCPIISSNKVTWLESTVLAHRKSSMTLFALNTHKFWLYLQLYIGDEVVSLDMRSKLADAT